MPISITPTNRSDHDEIRSTGSTSRNASARIPTNPTPAVCPNPQRTPVRQAARCSRTENGATAVRWSGPLTTWTAPATSPVNAANIRRPQSAASAPESKPRNGPARKT